ncbi:PEBP-like protein [Meredithblackwellia eburnea MCA 4105]
MAFKSALLIAASLAIVRAQSVPATADAAALALVDQQYVNSGLATNPNTGFGVPLKSVALLSVEYPFGIVQNGQPYTVDQVATAPTVYITPSNASASTSFTATNDYTLILADASSLGDPDTRGNYRHYLANYDTGIAATGANLTFTPNSGNVVTPYTAPGPIAGTGPHRYAWLLFAQPSTFAAPSDLAAPGTAAGVWNVSTYVQQSGLGDLLAASFFTVQNGNPTGSVAVTQAATSTSAAASGSSKAASSGASKSGSASSGAASASASTKAFSGASSVVVKSVGTLAIIAGGVAALLF